MNLYSVLLAGGKGSRAKKKTPKQFVKIHNKSIAEYSIELFINWFKKLKKRKQIHNGSIVFVAPNQYIKKVKKIYKIYNLMICEGGDHRHNSTKNGFFVIKQDFENKQIDPNNVIIFIHDTARPIFFEEDLEKMLEIFFKEKHIDAISLVSKTTESLVEKEEHKLKTLNRENIFSIKTPQALRGIYLDQFLNQPTKESYTDLISWALDQNLNIELIESSPFNIKITYPFDFEIVNFLLKHKKSLKF